MEREAYPNLPEERHRAVVVDFNSDVVRFYRNRSDGRCKSDGTRDSIDHPLHQVGACIAIERIGCSEFPNLNSIVRGEDSPVGVSYCRTHDKGICCSIAHELGGTEQLIRKRSHITS